MNITVINGTNVRGVTYKLKELFNRKFELKKELIKNKRGWNGV